MSDPTRRHPSEPPASSAAQPLISPQYRASLERLSKRSSQPKPYKRPSYNLSSPASSSMSTPDASQPLLSAAVPAVIHAGYSATHNPSPFAQSQSVSSLNSASGSSSSTPPDSPSNVSVESRESAGSADRGGVGGVLSQKLRLWHEHRTTDQDFTPTNIRYENWHRHHYEDIYYWGLRLSWKGFVGVLSLFFALMVVAFAAVNEAFVGGVSPSASFSDLLLLHFLLMSGYGTGPYVLTGTPLAILLSVETLVRTIYFTLITGLLYARFARPIPRIRFTDCAFVGVHHGAPSLTFRCANDRLESLINTNVQLTMSLNERMPNGGTWRRFHDLTLVRPSLPTFLLPWTVQHKIDAHSPLHGKTEDDWKAARIEVFVVVNAVDAVFGGGVWARKRYAAGDIRFGYRAKDVFRDVADEHGGPARVIDMAFFDAMVREDAVVESENKEQEATHKLTVQ